jgi:hypothetical protein
VLAIAVGFLHQDPTVARMAWPGPAGGEVQPAPRMPASAPKTIQRARMAPSVGPGPRQVNAWPEQGKRNARRRTRQPGNVTIAGA